MFVETNFNFPAEEDFEANTCRYIYFQQEREELNYLGLNGKSEN